MQFIICFISPKKSYIHPLLNSSKSLTFTYSLLPCFTANNVRREVAHKFWLTFFFSWRSDTIESAQVTEPNKCSQDARTHTRGFHSLSEWKFNENIWPSDILEFPVFVGNFHSTATTKSSKMINYQWNKHQMENIAINCRRVYAIDSSFTDHPQRRSKICERGRAETLILTFLFVHQRISWLFFLLQKSRCDVATGYCTDIWIN